MIRQFNPDSAVAIDKKREAQSFCSKVDRFVPLRRHRSAVLGGDVKLHRNGLGEGQNDFDTSESDAFAAPGLHLVSGKFGLTAESGFKLVLIFALVLVGGDLSFVRGQDLPGSEKQKIETLIKQVANLKDAKFVRNGSTYNADSAAVFLRRKWQANQSNVKTARDFIDKVASFSGTSGKPYLIRFKDGSESESRDFLLSQLKKLDP